MSSPTWDEYLAEATAHLDAVRALSEIGAPPPDAPVRPIDPMPEECRERVHFLAMGYDQLAQELTYRMETVAQSRRVLKSKNPHQERIPARYIDTPI